MRKMLAVAVLSVFMVACDENPSSPTYPKMTELSRTPAPTPTPRPTPPATLVGLWKIANPVPAGHALAGYAIEIASHDTRTGEIRGRSVTRYSELSAGAMHGTVRDLGDGRLHVDWQTQFGAVVGLTDTENGSMDVDAARRQMEGFIQVDFTTFGLRFTTTGVVLRKE